MNSERKIVEIVAVGEDACGIGLPESFLQRHNLRVGDDLWLTETPNGIAISAFNPDDTEEMKVIQRVMRENRDVLKLLADS